MMRFQLPGARLTTSAYRTAREFGRGQIVSAWLQLRFTLTGRTGRYRMSWRGSASSVGQPSWRCPDCCGVGGCTTCAGTGALPTAGVPVSGDAPPSDAAILSIASSVGMPSTTGADTLVLFARALLAACAPRGVDSVGGQTDNEATPGATT